MMQAPETVFCAVPVVRWRLKTSVFPGITVSIFVVKNVVPKII